MCMYFVQLWNIAEMSGQLEVNFVPGVPCTIHAPVVCACEQIRVSHGNYGPMSVHEKPPPSHWDRRTLSWQLSECLKSFSDYLLPTYSNDTFLVAWL